MPACRSNPKPQKTAESKGDLAALGFRVADSGSHTLRTLMLHELEGLLAAVPAGAPAKTHRKTTVAGNVLGTLKMCEETLTQGSQSKALEGYIQAFKREH